MNHAQRLAAQHARIRSKFGTDATGAQLYVWHGGAQVHAYQPSGTRGRDILMQSVIRDELVLVVATKAMFTTVPKSGDSIKLGTVLATARTLRVDDVKTTAIRPFYELSLIDPNTATTA